MDSLPSFASGMTTSRSRVYLSQKAEAEDEALGEGFCIGHSFFCNLEKPGAKELSRIVEIELAPLLAEYWYDESTKAREWEARLREAIQ